MSKNEALREEITLLKFRLKTARDKEILLLTQLLNLQKQHDYLLNHLKEHRADPVTNRTRK